MISTRDPRRMLGYTQQKSSSTEIISHHDDGSRDTEDQMSPPGTDGVIRSSTERHWPHTLSSHIDEHPSVADAQDPLMLDGDSDANEDHHNGRVHSSQDEWVPIMLRPLPSALLIAYCVGLILALELLNDLPSTRHGIPTTHKTAVQVVTYLPIVLVALLGIFWKRLIVDLKCIMPWACLSRTWTLGKDSLQLEYLDDLELSLIWPAARRHHWALLLALVSGLVSGGLVPLAAALTYVDPAGQITRSVVIHHDTFDFEDTLMNSDASLSLLKSTLGGLPWAGAAKVLQSDGSAPAWTTDSFAFAPFNTSDINLGNRTLTADTTAITAKLQCDILQVNTSVKNRSWGSDSYNIALESDTTTYINLTSMDDSQNPLSQTFAKDADSVIDRPVLWLNMSSTSVAPTQSAAAPVLITLLQPILNAGPQLYWSGTSDDRLVPVRKYRGMGLSCTPLFYTCSTSVSVNASNGVVTSYALDKATSSPIDIKLSSDYIIGYLNNPLHPETIFAITGDRNQIQVQDVITLGGDGNRPVTFYTSQSGSDPFGTQLLDLNIRPVDAYFDNYSLLELDASRVFATTMTQIMIAFSVANSSNTSLGETSSLEPLLRVQQPILRTLEACLAFLGIVVFCCAWPLRPRTLLSEDPNFLHFIARLVAQNKALDTNFTIDRQRTSSLCRNSHFRLRQEPGPVMHLDMVPAGVHPSIDVADKKASYEPLQLKQAARWSLLIALALYIVALGVLYRSGIQHGYSAETQEMQIAWSFVPTTLLVLIGYAISGTISAVQAMAPLAMLKTGWISGRHVMSFSPRNRSELTLPYHALFKMAYLPVLLSAIVALTFPAVKILAADLYQAFERPWLLDCTAQLSLPVFDFEQLAQTDGGTESRLRNTAAIRTDWVQLPGFGTQSQPNVVRNLVFQNVSVVAGDQSADARYATVELTALAVNMSCDLFTEDMFEVRVFNSAFGTTFGIVCRTAQCQAEVPYSTKDDYDVPYIALHFANWISYYDDPYSTLNRRFSGDAGTLFNSPTVQVIITDFGSIAEPVSNFSFIPDGPETVRPSSGMFNVSLPTTRAVSCTPVLQNVQVNATIERRVQAGLDGQSSTLPWAVTDFDPASIKIINNLNITDPQVWRKMMPKGTIWGRSPFVNRDNTLVNTSWPNQSQLADDDIRPASGIASNFFELLASYELSQGRAPTAVLNVTELASATTAVYGLYNAELLSHFRVSTPLLQSSRRDDDEPAQQQQQSTQAQLHTLQTRVKPNPTTTFAVIGMLSGILVLQLLVFLTTASENILLDKPGMISTQLSLFAGSSIVERLRGEDADSVWDERFSLGWWRVGNPDQKEAQGIRWGIDVGNLDAALQNYNVPKQKKTKGKRGISSSTIIFWRQNHKAGG